ncbi:MAG: exodeoxyribonuclease VII small subunit [Candidatus Coatesbacteria bacterium]|nr:exodeoxyribonuclease VII small subunit [Candidatus Coatesbacteria bacterium]
MGKFEDSMTRLEEIVNQMESGDQPLEDTLRLFREGMKLSEYCSGALSEAQRKVEILIKRADGTYDKEALDQEDDLEETESTEEEPE